MAALAVPVDLILKSLDTVMQGILIVDSDHRIVVANRRYVELFDIEAGLVAPGASYEGQLRRLAERGEYGPGDPDALVAMRMAPIQERKSWALDRQRPSGGHLFITGDVLPDGGYVFTFTDVTERVETAMRLEQAVAERTEQFRAAKEDAERALEAVTEAHDSLARANRLIEQSLQYASRIQSSMLPDLTAHGGLLRDVAAVWQPVNMVGGDLYWIAAEGGKCVVAVMDCTGHGVPGAFMAAIAGVTLETVLRHNGYRDPALILADLNRQVRTALRQDKPDSASNDGLDAGICLVEPAERRLTYAGANLPLLVQQGDAMRMVKGNRQSLGYRESLPDYVYTSHRIVLEPDQAFFLCSDGVIDQLGSEPPRLFGRRRLMQVLAETAGMSMGERFALVDAALEAWRAGDQRPDDVTMLGFVPHL